MKDFKFVKEEDSLFDFSVWLCPVTVFVFGHYPEKLYIS